MEEPKKIRKLVINGTDYIELKELHEQIMLLAMQEVAKGNIPSALTLSSLAGVLVKGDIYDTYPKESGTAIAGMSSVVSLFGDSVTTKEE